MSGGRVPRPPPARAHGCQAGTHTTRSSLGHRLGCPSCRRRLTARRTPAAQNRPSTELSQSGEQRDASRLEGHHTQYTTQKCLLLLLLLENGNPIFLGELSRVLNVDNLLEIFFFSKILCEPNKKDRQTGLGPRILACNLRAAGSPLPAQAGQSAGIADHQPGLGITPLPAPASSP